MNLVKGKCKMGKEKKWVYWHRVIWADNECKEGAQLKVGSLIGMNNKTKEAMRLICDDKNESISGSEYAKFKFVARILRTATPEEVVAQCGPAVIPIEAYESCDCKTGRTPPYYCKKGSDRNKKLLCVPNFMAGRCPKGLKPVVINP
ncbi:MAG: hypothetical protein PHX61_02620 [Alphaproteobacteria bacterium]|nr:hypothetical protein [Alphaproteobacteria bacterium]